MRAGRDSGPGPCGPASHPGSPCSTCAAELPGPDGSSRRSWAAPIWGWTPAPAPSTSHVRALATFPVASRSREIPPLPPGPFDVVLLFETMLAFPDKEPLLQEISRALPTGGRFAFTMEEGLPLTEAERERMPDADTVWLTPLEEMLALLGAGRAACPLAGGLQSVPPCRGGFLDQRVRRRCYGHCRADRAQGTGGAAGRPPALERLAAGGTGPQDRRRCGENPDATHVASRVIGSWSYRTASVAALTIVTPLPDGLFEELPEATLAAIVIAALVGLVRCP